MRVAALQHDIVWEERDATLAHLEPQVAAAAAAGAHLIVLTEMFATGFSMATHHTAEPVDGPIVGWMEAQSARHGVRLAGSVALAGEDGRLPTNSLLVVGPDGVEHRYDKVHPFSYAGEHERFAAGERAAVVADLEGVRVALTVCYDLRFADQYWAPAADVDVYLVVANWPETRRHHWRTLLDARAIENQAYVIGVNRVGEGGGLVYTGDSRIVDPMGEVLASGAAGETMLFADLDPTLVSAIRDRFPFMRDR
jgi:predicted amidohydrolase